MRLCEVSVCPTDSLSHFCLINSVCPLQHSQAAPADEWQRLCDVDDETLTHCVFVSVHHCLVIVTYSGNF